jgi:hypothetical protein
MKTVRLLFAACACLATAFGTYTYDDPNLLNPYNSSQWNANGTNSASNNMYTSSSSTGGSLIFKAALPAPANNYEVKTTLTLVASGGYYITYLRATSGSLLATGNAGTFYAVEVANPTFSNGVCTATMNVYKQTGLNNLTGPFATTPISCHTGMVVRSVFNQGNGIAIYIDNRFITSYYDGAPIASGQPGVGVASAPTGNGISAIDIGHLDTVAPNPITAQMVGTSSFPTHVDIQFPEVLDDPIGTGVAYYQFYRNGSWLTFSTTPVIEDRTVAAGTAYAYALQAVDYHGNVSQININITTPPAGAIDPREVGVRPTGTYWGSGGEQIDMRSGNLNFTIPMLKALSRGGGGVGFNLSYNSQNWRQDPGGTWQLGRDVGYGYGWRLQAGSLTPVYHDYWTLDHYLFIDSTGAEYRLDVNTNGVWTSKESIYVSWDSNSNRFYFPDGSCWFFGSLSAGTEEDSGTMYPTQMNDSNGNYLSVTYDGAQGVGGTNSSSRIIKVEDVRGNGAADYTFTYDLTHHLSGIANSIGTAEKYTFGYATNTLTSPFTPATGYGPWTFLASVANGIPLTTSFTYDSSGSGELHNVTFPYLGSIRWAYGAFNYSGTRTQREVNGGRFLTMSAGATELFYGLYYSGNANTTLHLYSQVDDPDGQSEKAWAFDTVSTDAGFALVNYILGCRSLSWFVGNHHRLACLHWFAINYRGARQNPSTDSPVLVETVVVAY